MWCKDPKDTNDAKDTKDAEDAKMAKYDKEPKDVKDAREGIIFAKYILESLLRIKLKKMPTMPIF